MDINGVFKLKMKQLQIYVSFYFSLLFSFLNVRGEIIMYISVYLVIVNIVGFFIMGIDKQKARKGAYRISEDKLWSIAIIGGAIGSTVAMYFFRHKTKHPHFKLGFPLLAFLQLFLLYLWILKL